MMRLLNPFIGPTAICAGGPGPRDSSFASRGLLVHRSVWPLLALGLPFTPADVFRGYSV